MNDIAQSKYRFKPDRHRSKNHEKNKKCIVGWKLLSKEQIEIETFKLELIYFSL